MNEVLLMNEVLITTSITLILHNPLLFAKYHCPFRGHSAGHFGVLPAWRCSERALS
jgi:hypothetical protein